MKVLLVMVLTIQYSTLTLQNRMNFIDSLPIDYCQKIVKDCVCLATTKIDGVILKADIQCNQHRVLIKGDYPFAVKCLNGTLPENIYDTQHYKTIGNVVSLQIISCNNTRNLVMKNIFRTLGLESAKSADAGQYEITVRRMNPYLMSIEEIDLKVYESIPETILYEYENLTTLEIGMNVKNFSTRLFAKSKKLKHLLWLNGARCGIKDEMFEDLRNLVTISIDFRDLFLEQKVSGEICNKFEFNFHYFTSVEHIVLSNTFEKRVDRTFFRGAFNLNQISIINNPNLRYLPDDLLKDQTNLTYLVLKANSLETLTKDLFRTTKKLTYLNLAKNKLKVFDLDLSLLLSLQELKLDYLSPANVSLAYKQFEFLQNLPTFECASKQTCSFYTDTIFVPCPPNCVCYFNRIKFIATFDCHIKTQRPFPIFPISPTAGSSLRIENQEIKVLPHKQNFEDAHLRELYAAGNNLTQLRLDQLPTELEFLDVSNNELQDFETDVMDFFTVRKPNIIMKLSENPWKCDCNTLTLLRFIKNFTDEIVDVSQMRCKLYPDKPMADLEETDICPSYLKEIIISIGIFILIVIFILVTLFLIYEQQIKIWLYENEMCLGFVAEEDLDSHKVYDAFVSYSTKDIDVIPQLVAELEGGSQPFKLCLHDRDWLAGDVIADQIARTIEGSKRILIILSQNYLESVWGRMEFRLAYQASMEERRRRLIIIVYGKLEELQGIDTELGAYLKLNTYIKWNDPNFWRKLRYAMPHRGRTMRDIRRLEQNNGIEMEYRM